MQKAFIAGSAKNAIVGTSVDSFIDIAMLEARKRDVLFAISASVLPRFIDQQFQTVTGHQFGSSQSLLKPLAVLDCYARCLQQRAQSFA